VRRCLEASGSRNRFATTDGLSPNSERWAHGLESDAAEIRQRPAVLRMGGEGASAEHGLARAGLGIGRIDPNGEVIDRLLGTAAVHQDLHLQEAIGLSFGAGKLE
jgi:hypothetical protein